MIPFKIVCINIFWTFMVILLSYVPSVWAQEANENLQIVDRPIVWNEYREQLIREYSQTHYGLTQINIVPQAVVIHWTAASTLDSAYWTFYNEARNDGTLNVASHFLVDRDGTIYHLTSETALNRHIIGYNWCAIGIENVGGVDGREDLTDEQLHSNIMLIRYLGKKYTTIKYVFGHYQQDKARESGLYIENVSGYHSVKIDPGPVFMNGLRMRLEEDGFSFFYD